MFCFSSSADSMVSFGMLEALKEEMSTLVVLGVEEEQPHVF